MQSAASPQTRSSNRLETPVSARGLVVAAFLTVVAVVLLLALSGRTPDLAHHTVLFPDDYDAEDPWQFKNVIVR